MQDTDYKGLMAAIADASTPLVVDMHAPWCKYCKTTRPHLDRLSEERAGQIRFVAIDTDEHSDTIADPGFKTLPNIILFVDGKEVERRGSGDYENLTAWLASHGL